MGRDRPEVVEERGREGDEAAERVDDDGAGDGPERVGVGEDGLRREEPDELDDLAAEGGVGVGSEVALQGRRERGEVEAVVEVDVERGLGFRRSHHPARPASFRPSIAVWAASRPAFASATAWSSRSRSATRAWTAGSFEVRRIPLCSRALYAFAARRSPGRRRPRTPRASPSRRRTPPRPAVGCSSMARLASWTRSKRPLSACEEGAEDAGLLLRPLLPGDPDVLAPDDLAGLGVPPLVHLEPEGEHGAGHAVLLGREDDADVLVGGDGERRRVERAGQPRRRAPRAAAT